MPRLFCVLLRIIYFIHNLLQNNLPAKANERESTHRYSCIYMLIFHISLLVFSSYRQLITQLLSSIRLCVHVLYAFVVVL